MRNRIRQFKDASRLPVATDYALAQRLLTPTLFAMFEAQHPRDIVHSAATAAWLESRGTADEELLAAALLHDIGKGEQRRADRVAFVVAHRTGVVGLLARERSQVELRRALYRSLHHSTTGADRLERAGAGARVVDLVRRHHDPPGQDVMLALLQRADAAT